MEKLKLTSNLNQFNLLVLGLGIHWIRLLMQVWKVKSMNHFGSPFSSLRHPERKKKKRLRLFPKRYRGMYVTDDPTIIIQRNDHTSLEMRGRYISDDPTIRLHFARFKKIENDSEKRQDRGK